MARWIDRSPDPGGQGIQTIAIRIVLVEQKAVQLLQHGQDLAHHAVVAGDAGAVVHRGAADGGPVGLGGCTAVPNSGLGRSQSGPGGGLVGIGSWELKNKMQKC